MDLQKRRHGAYPERRPRRHERRVSPGRKISSGSPVAPGLMSRLTT